MNRDGCNNEHSDHLHYRRTQRCWKTTFASRFLPEYVHCTEFLNADLIAAGLSPFDPESQNIRASELMLERMDGLIERRETFSFETTLAARSYRQKIIG